MIDIARLTKAIDMNCEYLGISRLLLMENAGREIARNCEKFNPKFKEFRSFDFPEENRIKRVAVFSGTGNNGGDGFVAARHLSGIGKNVRVYAIDGERTIEAQRNFEIIQNLDSVEIELIRDSSDSEKIKKEIGKFDLIVDALIGVGLKGDVREPVKSIIKLINSARAFRISVDIPSGGGKNVVNANLTISLHLPKTENVAERLYRSDICPRGKASRPHSKVVPIGIPKEAESLCGPGDVYLSIPKRSGFEHKGDFGRVIVIGGSKNFVGTPSLVAKAALRTGADIAIISCPGYVAEKLPFDPNLIVNPMESEFYFSESDVDNILNINFDSVVIGNGLGTQNETSNAVRKFLKLVNKPVVIDADALKLIDMKDLRKNFILTPHEIEFKILFKEQEKDFNKKIIRNSVSELRDLRSRIKMVEKFARNTNTTILLKGPVDIISDGERTKLNRTGNPGMTVGGTGDVLAGIIGALSAVSEDKFEAACAGAFLSGLSGDFACEDFRYSLIATDVIERIPEAIRFCNGFE